MTTHTLLKEAVHNEVQARRAAQLGHVPTIHFANWEKELLEVPFCLKCDSKDFIGLTIACPGSDNVSDEYHFNH